MDQSLKKHLYILLVVLKSFDVTSSTKIVPRESRIRTNWIFYTVTTPLFCTCTELEKRNNTLIDLRKRFVNIKLDHAQHPCFARVWIFRL